MRICRLDRLRLSLLLVGLAAFVTAADGEAESAATRDFLAKSCYACHDGETKKGGLDLTALPQKWDDPSTFATWVKVHDRTRAGEMPPPKKPRPDAKELDAAMTSLKGALSGADAARQQREGRAGVRRLNRVEYENALRDLLCIQGEKLKDNLPEDGKAHGFDKSADALDLSFVHVESYLAAVDKALNAALCPLPEAPPTLKYRYRPWDAVHHEGREVEGSVVQALRDKTGILLNGMSRDDTFTFDTPHHIIDREPLATAFGLFRHEDADYRCRMSKFQAFYNGWYKLRVSGYSFGWDGTQVVPTERHGALGWGCYQKNEHYGTVDLPPNKAAEREVTAWLERGRGMDHPNDDFIRIIGASLENVRDYAFGKNKDLIGPPWAVPGVAIEWVEIEGPFNEQWPPASHKAMFGDLPVKEWTKELNIPKPTQQVWARGNPNSEPKDLYGERGQKRPVVFVETKDPEHDAERLLRSFLRRAFRRPATEAEVGDYVAKVKAKLQAGVAFEDALRSAYREALVSPEFMFVNQVPPVPSPAEARRQPGANPPAQNVRADARTPAGEGTGGTALPDDALAERLSFFFWSSLPDETLSKLADAGTLHEPAVLRAQVERMLADPKGARFTENFLGQWLNLREIGATNPDRKLYPEFMPYLQDAMVMEARATFDELLKNDLPVTNLVKADFAMINEPLSELYGIAGVRGWDIRKVQLPAGSPRGGFLTMAAVLKTTANGTTTSPVKRGAFVMDRILGVVPSPPPPDAGSVEPDTRGTTTIREQLDKHKRNATCGGCHMKMDGYGFALESFDVIGGWREKYRALGGNLPPERKTLHGKKIEYADGPTVDCTGVMPDGRPFKDVANMKEIFAAEPDRLARAFAEHLVTYGTGAEISFADRAKIDTIVKNAAAKQYGLRSLLMEVVQSELFTRR